MRLATELATPANEVTTPTYGQLVADIDAITVLRQLMPARALALTEARSIAERQAATLLDLMNITEPLVPMFVIHSLPGISVEWRQGLLVSGMSVRTNARWRIAIRAEECRQRQRFSLAHEFKHVLDSPVIVRTHAHLKPERQKARAEQLCDYFAACLLMPRPWVKHDYYGGVQNIRALARRYYVSQDAMATRLSELGLIAQQPCPRASRSKGATR